MLPEKQRIEATGSRPNPGSVMSPGGLDFCELKDAPEGTRPLSLYLVANGTAPGAVKVSLTLGRSGRGGAEVKREFHVDARGAWLSVAGWDVASLQYEAGPSGMILAYAWLTLPVPSSRPIFFWQSIAAPGTIPCPPGARVVTPAIADAGATWIQTDGGAPFVIAAPLVAGAPLLVAGSSLTILVAPQTVCWELEPV